MTRRLATVATLGILAAMVLTSVLAWAHLPAGTLIPVHWQDNLTPDRFVSRDYGLVLMPLVTVFTFGLLSMLATVESSVLEAINFRHAAHWASVAAAGGFATAHGYAILLALGRASAGKLVIAAAVLVALGAMVASTRRQLLLRLHAAALREGRFVWDHAHLLVGGLLVAGGVTVFLAGFFGVLELGRAGLMLSLGAGVLAAGAYGFAVYRTVTGSNR